MSTGFVTAKKTGFKTDVAVIKIDPLLSFPLRCCSIQTVKQLFSVGVGGDYCEPRSLSRTGAASSMYDQAWYRGLCARKHVELRQ
jgi:hypothetical protein